MEAIVYSTLMMALTWLSLGLLALAGANQAHLQPPMYHDAQHPLSELLHAASEDPLLSLHQRLVSIESITGNEYAVGKYLHAHLAKHNFTVEEQEVENSSEQADAFEQAATKTKPRFNLLAYPGSNRNTRVVLSSHIDTVPPFWPYATYGDEIWGRGSVDDKACVAAQIAAVEELLASKEIDLDDVSLLFVVGEEIGGDGMRRANDFGVEWESAIFGEPTELKLAAGHKGMLGLRIKATGRAAHSGYPWLGESANSMLLPALVKLEKLQLSWSEKYGNSTLNIGKIEGGIAMNVIAETATADVAIRIANGTAEEMQNIVLDAIREVDDRLEVSFIAKGYGPIDIDHDVEGLCLTSAFMWVSPLPPISFHPSNPPRAMSRRRPFTFLVFRKTAGYCPGL